MRMMIFSDAKKLIPYVVNDARAKDTLFFKFNIDDSPIVEVKCDGKKTYIAGCSCSHHSVHQGHAERVERKLMLCSYTLSVLGWLINNSGGK